MGNTNRDKILFVVDGSPHSLQTVRYASSILDPGRFEIVLLHIMTKVPESFIDLEKIPAYKYRLVDVDAWERHNEDLIRDFMEKARAILLQAGFAGDSVTVRIDARKAGIARDIAAESRNGYRAVAVGRKGMSELKDFMLGSIAGKIMELAPIPVWIISGSTTPRKVLMCTDFSPNAASALDHLSLILGGYGSCEITLFHVVRTYHGFRKLVHDMFAAEDPPGGCDAVEREFGPARMLEPALDKEQACLVSAGMDPVRITRRVVSGTANSANTIIEEAENGGYDTIVVGRRGISHTEEFVMGRVSNKVVHLARDKTVWVVG